MRPYGTPQQLEDRRRRAMALLRKGKSYRDVASSVKASLSSVVRWSQAHRKKGVKGLRCQVPWGQPSRLTSGQKKDLKQQLLKGSLAAGYATDLWTLKRMGRLIQKRYNVSYTPVGVWKLLRQGLKWSCQKPERRALQRDEKAIAEWKSKTWPHIKKGQTTWGPSGVFG